MLACGHATEEHLSFTLRGRSRSSLLAIRAVGNGERTEVSLLLKQLFANRISAFFAMDVIVSSVVVFAFVRSERSRLGNKWWLPLVAVLTVGVSLGLPLALYLREGRADSRA